MRRTLVALVLAMGCGGSETDSTTATGFVVEVRSIQPWLRGVDLRAKVDALVDRQAQHLGVAPPRLDAWRLVVVDGPVACGHWAGGQAVFGGCTWFRERTITISADYHPRPELGCLAATDLPHEIGHALLQTAEHSDPRWDAIHALWQQQIEELCAGS